MGEDAKSFQATNENIAMVTLHVENITWLGKPYSICVREPDYGFAYTKQNCMLECEGKKLFFRPKKAFLTLRGQMAFQTPFRSRSC